MFEIKDSQTFYTPPTVECEDRGIRFIMDPQGPHWVATDDRGAGVLARVRDSLPVSAIIRRNSHRWNCAAPPATTAMTSISSPRRCLIVFTGGIPPNPSAAHDGNFPILTNR